ncbi:acyltransferase family protein [Lentibacillus saliphilus]|uniref:acyltransferase family protein n=1 Tax=Lentibacillus saliphilus TaxID=2737028 RepID=UPI001C2FF5C8|nr:acyltransferase family protein [Lentibacillus saliphilus]
MSDLNIPEKKFRPELEGVRAVAALLVAIYHIWLGSVSGGVDVFFIVSGYLITTSLISRIGKQGKIHFFEYILGLGRRLFPIAFIVLIFSIIFSYFLLAQTQWKQIIAEVFASAFYFQNWQLAANAVDYLAQNNAATPLQHFWALSIQGQFYVTWPLIISLTFVLARKLFKTPFRKTLLAVLGSIFVASLTYSIYITTTNQPWAYFDTFARVWEFSLGGILALTIPYLVFNKMVNTVIGWIGLGIILFTGILLPVSTVFPGYAALLPTTGVILIIIAAENVSQFNVKRFVGSKPFLFFGSISYGFYLWHWPLLIFYYAIFNVDEVSFRDGLIILLLTFILSFVSTKVIESPIRKLSIKESKKKLAIILLLFMIPLLTMNTFWSQYHERAQEAFQQQIDILDYPGARVLYDESVEATAEITPIASPINANSPLPSFYEDDCFVPMDKSGLKVCSYGETENPDYTIALVGGSHSGHWFPALEQFAEDLNLKIDVYNKDACRFSNDDFNGNLSDTCMEWNEKVVNSLMTDPPDLIFTTATLNREPNVPQGYLDMWKKFEGISTIFAIRDNPRMKEDTPTCVELHGPEACGVPRSEGLSDIPPWENLKEPLKNVYFADLSDYFCDDDTCHSVIGNVLVYRDQHHISTLYSKTLAEPLKAHIVKALEQVDKHN